MQIVQEITPDIQHTFPTYILRALFRRGLLQFPALPFSLSSAPAPISLSGVYLQEPLRRSRERLKGLILTPTPTGSSCIREWKFYCFVARCEVLTILITINNNRIPCENPMLHVSLM